jgi:hypothetical protein
MQSPLIASACSAAIVHCTQCDCLAKEVANVLMSRCQRMLGRDRLDLETMVGVVDLKD